MGDDHSLLASDRAVEQAIVSLKKGAHLLKYGRRGKPKFCPFRLSMDEKSLVWYSGQMEKQLKLSQVTSITRGQNNKQMQPEKESQSLSLVYSNGERSLNLICKDKEQADLWYLGLKAIISRNHSHRFSNTLRNQRGSQSCVSSPASFMRMKQIMGLSDGTARSSQVHSVNGSPAQSLSERGSDGQSCSSDSFYSESSLSSGHSLVDSVLTGSPYSGAHDQKSENRILGLSQLGRPPHGSTHHNKLRDLLIWGEGVEGGCFGGGEVQCDALIPKVMDSTMMLDVQSLSLGAKHAAIVTKQGEVFTWGEGKRGRLGHKVDTDTAFPKPISSLSVVFAKSVSCGEYHTCALSDSGELYTWGDSSGRECDNFHWLPRKISAFLDGVSIVSVACGQWHTAAVSSSGQLFTFGDGTFGVLGHGNVSSFSHPKEVESLSGFWVKSVACGPWHTAAIVEVKTDCFRAKRRGGKLFTWGDGDKGKLGHSDHGNKLYPTCVTELVDHDFDQVACGNMLTVGLTNMGKVYAMGSSVHGQLGNPHGRDKSITIVQGKLRDEHVKKISAGSYHVVALTSRGSVFSWGKGVNGQLGLGDTRDRNTPALIEALRERQVEQITCGANSTAAICLHKSMATTDQTSCKGCGTAFGFTKKKQNCYNCGLLFCRVCCSKKAANASLAPTRMKPFRVCDPCFKKLQRAGDSVGTPRFEPLQSPRPLLGQHKTMSEEKEYRGDASGAWSRKKLTTSSFDEKIQWDNKQQDLELSSSTLGGLPRWGQVACPEAFQIDSTDQTMGLSSRLLSLNTHFQAFQGVPQSPVINAVKGGKDLSQLDRVLAAEVDKLRVEVESLKKLCQTRKEKIQECQEKVKEAWAIAKEEAEKSKAAKEVIKALTSRICTMSEKLSTERNGEHEAAGANLLQIKCVDNLSQKSSSQVVNDQCESMEGRPGESLCASPIIFSSSLKYLRDNANCNGEASALVEKSSARKTSHVGKQGVNASKPERVEKYQQGVYVTLSTLPNGQTNLRRIKFSRKKFSEKEAERWWDENQQLVYQKYKIEECSDHAVSI